MKPCVVIPTYNNARTLAAVVRDARVASEAVLVVDDGSTDETPAILAGLVGIDVLRHDRNRGKGAALQTGLSEALKRGFTHAITLDSDGQHHAADIAPMIAAAVASPTALILGRRDLRAAGAGPGSRIGCANSNFWTWVETGSRLPDTQTGFRVYPLAAIGQMAFSTEGFDFEIEVLVRAAWIGVPLRSHPVAVTYFRGSDRVSHFRPWHDFLRIARLNCRLVAQRLFLPSPALHLFSLRAFRQLPRGERWRAAMKELFLSDRGSSVRIAASVGLGCFMGLTPAWGFQLVLAVLGAHWLGLSKSIAAVASNISIPFLIPGILYASLMLGRATLGRGHETVHTAGLNVSPADFPAWLLGSLMLATIVGGVATALTWLVVEATRARTRRRAQS